MMGAFALADWATPRRRRPPEPDGRRQKALDEATAAHDAALAAATQAQAELAGLQERERAVTAREQVSSRTRKLPSMCASSANAARGKSLDDREVELTRHDR